MATSSQIFWLPRRGSSPAEYEDACAANDATGRYAVADGASEGCFTDLWARLLAKDFVDRADCPAGDWPVSLSAAQAEWDADVRGREIAWHAEPWVQQGAYAAFLGISLTGETKTEPLDEQHAEDAKGTDTNSRDVPEGKVRPMESIRFSAVAVGDACLFHTRDRALLRAFPLERAEQFNNAPKLVGARMPLEQIHKKRCSWADGEGRRGDRLWAMTDALARWCLAEVEAGGNPWAELASLVDNLPSLLGKESGGDGLELPSPACEKGAEGEDTEFPLPTENGAATKSPGEGGQFAEWIDGLRRSGRLRNDDVTLLAIRL